MNVVLAYTKIAPGVASALDATGAKWEQAWTGASDTAYWELIDRLWHNGQTCCVVEHDVLVRPDSLRELEACEQPWCSFVIPYLASEYAGMGCVKFTSDLIHAVPDAVHEAGEQTNDRHSRRHWCLLDNSLRMVLSRAGFSPCEHRPALKHWREHGGIPQPSHGCVGVQQEATA